MMLNILAALHFAAGTAAAGSCGKDKRRVAGE